MKTPLLEFERWDAGIRVWTGASLIAFDLPERIGVSIHFGVFPDHWFLGCAYEEYDMCMTYAGLGPLVYVAAIRGCPLDNLIWNFPREIRGACSSKGARFRAVAESAQEWIAGLFSKRFDHPDQ